MAMMGGVSVNAVAQDEELEKAERIHGQVANSLCRSLSSALFKLLIARPLMLQAH